MEIISDQADLTKHTSKEEEKTGQNELLTLIVQNVFKSEYKVFIVHPRKCDEIHIKSVCVCVFSSFEAPMHGDEKPHEPSDSPKRSSSEDTDDSIPAKRPRAQDEISSEQVGLNSSPLKNVFVL